MAKGKSTKAATRIGRWYQPDDVKTHFKRKNNKNAITKLKKNIHPGQVLILLAGRFKGKRVVFLKQLPSGLLLVTGPHKVNGVPLKRVNQSFVIPTSTKVDLAGVNSNDVTENLFKKPKTKAAKSADAFYTESELTEAQKKVEEERKKKRYSLQSSIDTALCANIKKVDMLKQYLGARFTLTKNTRPHELIF